MSNSKIKSQSVPVKSEEEPLGEVATEKQPPKKRSQKVKSEKTKTSGQSNASETKPEPTASLLESIRAKKKAIQEERRNKLSANVFISAISLLHHAKATGVLSISKEGVVFVPHVLDEESMLLSIEDIASKGWMYPTTIAFEISDREGLNDRLHFTPSHTQDIEVVHPMGDQPFELASPKINNVYSYIDEVLSLLKLDSNFFLAYDSRGNINFIVECPSNGFLREKDFVSSIRNLFFNYSRYGRNKDAKDGQKNRIGITCFKSTFSGYSLEFNVKLGKDLEFLRIEHGNKRFDTRVSNQTLVPEKVYDIPKKGGRSNA